MTDAAHLRTGAAAEALAAQYLQAHGLRILTRNFRVKGGEIDLVARDGQVLVFVEVRLRSNERFGGAGASITATKQRRILLATQHYLQQVSGDPACRFDCILLSSLNPDAIEWIKGAFSAGDG